MKFPAVPAVDGVEHNDMRRAARDREMRETLVLARTERNGTVCSGVFARFRANEIGAYET